MYYTATRFFHGDFVHTESMEFYATEDEALSKVAAQALDEHQTTATVYGEVRNLEGRERRKAAEMLKQRLASANPALVTREFALKVIEAFNQPFTENTPVTVELIKVCLQVVERG